MKMNKRDKRSNVKKNHAKTCTSKHDSTLTFYVLCDFSICDLHLKTFLPQTGGQQSKVSVGHYAPRRGAEDRGGTVKAGMETTELCCYCMQ
jgi:hypothetical protein